MVKHKNGRSLSFFEAVGCPNTDKSRPYIVRTLADLLLVFLLNFLHSEETK